MKKVIFSMLALSVMLSLWLAQATAQEYVLARTLNEEHTGDIIALNFTYNTIVISGSLDDTLRRWKIDGTSNSSEWTHDVGNDVWTICKGFWNRTTSQHVMYYGGPSNYDIRSRISDTGSFIKSLEGHTDTVRDLDYHNDRQELASASYDGTVKIWKITDTHTTHLQRTLRDHTGSVYSVAWRPNGRVLASGGSDGTVRLWNPSNGINFAVLRGHTETVRVVTFSKDGRLLASGSEDNTIRIWDANTQRLLRVLNDSSDVRTLSFHSTEDILASGNFVGTIRLWNPNTGASLGTLTGNRGLWQVAFAPSTRLGDRLVSAGGDPYVIRVWERITADVTGNGVVNVSDLVEVARNYGKTVAGGANQRADINGDGRVDIKDITLVARAINSDFAAPSVVQELPNLLFNAADVQQWIKDANRNGIDAQGIAVLEQLLEALLQSETVLLETALLANYPNPFNPETWIPYQLAKPAEVRVSIHSAAGKLVRTLELGQLPAGAYQDKDRAAYWDGRNEQGESVASGVYFYTLKAGEFSATKKMLIRK